jgi:hypothetical protein
MKRPRTNGINPRDKYLHDIPEAAALLSSSEYQVREWCKTGKLKYMLSGNGWVISPAAIAAFIEENEKSAEEHARLEKVKEIVA